mgnify:CR=1
MSMILGILVDAHWPHYFMNVRSSLTADFKRTQYARFEPGADILKAIKSLV